MSRKLIYSLSWGVYCRVGEAFYAYDIAVFASILIGLQLLSFASGAERQTL